MQKFSFALFALAFVLFFSSCSLLFNASSSDEATLTFRLGGELFSKMKHSRAVVDDAEDGYYLDIEIKGGFSAKKTASLSQSGATVSFEEIPAGVTIWAQAQAYKVVDGEKVIYFVGESDKVTIAEGENEISLVMKKYESADTEEEEIGAKFYVTANAEANTVGDGSKEKPFKSVEIALQSLPTTSENIILILSGAFQTPQTIPESFALTSGCTLTIRGGDSSAKLSEGFTSSSSTVPITLKDLSVSSNIEVATYSKVTIHNVNALGQIVINRNGQLLLKGSTTVAGVIQLLNADAKIIVAGPLSASTVATITPSAYTAGAQLIEVAEGAGVSMSNVYKKFKVKANGTTECSITSEGKLSRPYGTKSKPNAIGDIVFNDGSATAYSSNLTLTDDEKANAVAVIFYIGAECSNDGSTNRTLGVGLYKSENTYTFGSTSPSIVCTPSAQGVNKAGRITYEGDVDGSDNFEIVPNSPVMSWAVNTYVTKIKPGIYTTGWYLPSIMELDKLSSVLFSTINPAIQKIGLTAITTTLQDKIWSSSAIGNYGISIEFSNGIIEQSTTVTASRSIAIREF